MPSELYNLLSFIVLILGMLGAFHFGRLKRDDPIFKSRSLPPIIDLGEGKEEEEINLPKDKVGRGGFDAEEEIGETEEER